MRSVRAKVLLLVLLPVLSLFGLYLFITGITGKDALNLTRARALKSAAGEPVNNFLRQLDTERVVALTYLSVPAPRNLAKLRAQEVATAHMTAALRAGLTFDSTLSNAAPAAQQAAVTLLRDAAGLPRLHSSIASRAVTRPQALAAYNKMIGDSYLLLHQVILAGARTPIVAQALALERIAESGELLQQENTLLVADMAAHTLPLADQHAFTRLAGARSTLYGLALPELAPGYRAMYRRDVSPGAYAALTALENTVISSGHSPLPPPVAPGSWGRAVQGVSSGLARARTQADTALDHQTEHQVRMTDLRLLLLAGLGLLALVASIVVSLLAGRGLVREISGLRRSAEDMADHLLPSMVDQATSGGNPDVAEEPLDIKVKTAEIAQIRDALAKVQHTAVDAAVGQARLRQSIGEVFRNVARRSQSLLHRQLALLDRMERRTEDPQELEDLFRVDHLTTCMRRHAESLIILSGQSPARGWRNPVPFVDVIRAAVAEVEDYTRVSVISTGDTGLAGPAVGDVIHMIAELVENATINSPPNTPVLIQGGIVGQGFAIEIEDRGLGMSDGKLAETNARLADPLPFESAGTDQLGLLVAGQLAKRHDIQITLRRNPYGGTTAIVLLPHGLVVAEGFGELEPAKALEVAPPMLGQHPAGERNGFADEAATEPDLHDGDMPGEAAAAGAPPLGYQPAPPPAAPPATAAPPAAAQPRAEAGPPPSAETGAPDPAEAESRTYNGMESPAWGGPPQPTANPSTPNGATPPVLPRRVRRSSLAPGRSEGPPTYSSLPGRFPSQRSPEETRITMPAIQPAAERRPSMPGLANGQRQEPGAAEADGAGSSNAAEADGAGSSGAAGDDDPRGA
jgi:Nitrate and nitrite sensing/Histidine kinase-, DNA gyrase B-, and HSP90-like ATPase